MSKSATRLVVLAGLAGAALVASLPARAQDEGETVVITLKSGKKYTATLVSKDSSNVKFRIGKSELSMPASAVVSIEKPAPEPSEGEPAPESGGGSPGGGGMGGGTSGGAPAGGAEAPSAAAEGSPKGAALTLKDGTVMIGYVLAKEEGKIWFVPGRVLGVAESDIESAEGNLEPPGGAGAIRITGDKAADGARLVKELASGVPARVNAAWAVLRTMGREAIPTFLAGLKSPSAEARDLCIEGLCNYQVKEAIVPLMAMLRDDRDPRIRCSVAGRLGQWDPPLARRAILDAVWQDRDQMVKSTGLLALEKTAGPEEVSALMDLLSIIPTDSEARGSLFRVLKNATGERFAPDAELWINWWNGEGREKVSVMEERVREARIRREQAAAMGVTEDVLPPTTKPGEPTGPPAEALKDPTPPAPPSGGPETPPPAPGPAPEGPK
jgi:hypothetical protein